MNELFISKSGFTDPLSGLIASGVTFTAVEQLHTGLIKITFTGGY